MRKTESRRYRRAERVRRWESEGRPNLVIEGTVSATARWIGDGMTAATIAPWVTACERPSPAMQQASALGELPVAPDLAQHAIRVFADGSQPIHTVANVGMNPINSASEVTTAIRRERIPPLWTFPSAPSNTGQFRVGR